MIDRGFRSCALGLLASTALASPAIAQQQPPGTAAQVPVPDTGATDVTAPPPAVQQAQDGQVRDQTEIIITATKRSENLQNVAQSVQVLGTRKLDQLDISNFEQYTKQLPSVSYNVSQSGGAVVYMRGVASGGDGNHSASPPSVGVYLDEQPVTTIGGALDVHIYDIARIESLAGPQGTLYGALSEAGTIRIITNKPDLNATYGRVDGELNLTAHAHEPGGKMEGMINVPIVADRVAFRASGFYERDPGFIDNVYGSRTYCGTPIKDSGGETIGCNHDGFSVNNSAYLKRDINDAEMYGGRAALKIDLDDNWTVTPTIMHQYAKYNGFGGADVSLGDLQAQRFRGDEYRKDQFTQAALTIEGKIWNFDVTYAGAYMDRPTQSIADYTDYVEAYDNNYTSSGGIYNYLYFLDSAGNPIEPHQDIFGTEHFKKFSQELRIATPKENRARALFGAFYQRQSNHIFQNYLVPNLAPDLSVNGWPGTIWLTLQDRVDRDWAIFAEGEFDVTPKVTLIAGGRLYRFDNSLFGFAGFGKNPAYGIDPDAPPNAAGASGGVRRCLTVNGEQAIDDPDAALASGALADTPCTNVGSVEGGVAVPKHTKGDGFIHRLSARFKPTDKTMFYATWSRGFRPGGLNRAPGTAPYNPDYLTNYEAGWKTTFGPVTWNGAAFHQVWKSFQFSFLGPNSLTIVQNGRDAIINGVESDLNYVGGGLTLSASAAYTDAKTKGNICEVASDDENCSASSIITPSGTRLPVTPRFKATGTARYTWPVAMGNAHVQGNLTHQSSASADLRQVNTLLGINPNAYLGRIGASTVVNLFAGFDWKQFNAEIFANNVFDERNEQARFVACSSCTRTYILPGRPRTIGIRAGMKF
ncbi:MAG: TonB-dependent receptor [Sphingomicrobium sp.]